MAEIPQQRYTPAGPSGSGLYQRLEGFKNKFLQVAHKENVRIGTERAQRLEFSDKDGDGITDAPEFSKVGIFSSVENMAFNKAAESLYRDSLENDIRGQMNRFKAEFPDDQTGYESSVMGFRKALASGTDPRARQQALLSIDAKFARDIGPVMIKSRERITLRSRQEAMYKAEARLSDVQSLAQAGQVPDALEVLKAYAGDVRGMMEAGQISTVEGWKLEREAQAMFHEESLTGKVKQLAADGKEVEAIRSIERFREKPNEWLTVEERDTISDNLVKELDAAIDFQDRVDDILMDDIKKSRKDNSTTLFEGITEGIAGNRQVAEALRNGDIDQSQAENLYRWLRTQGEGTTDDDVVLILEERMRGGEDISEDVKNADPTELDQKTRLRLLRKNAVIQEENKEAATADSAVKVQGFTKNTTWKFYNKLVEDLTKVPNALSRPDPADKAARVETLALWFEGSKKIAEANPPNKEELWRDWGNQLLDNEKKRQALIPWDRDLGVTPEKALRALSQKGKDIDGMKEGKEKEQRLAEFKAEWAEQWPRIEGAIKLKEFDERVQGIAR